MPTNGKIVLKRQTAHADAVAGLVVPLPGLRRTAEPVWSTRLQTFNSVQLSPFVRVSLEMLAFSSSSCPQSVCIQYLKHVTVKTMSTRALINAIWWNIKVNVQKLADICGYKLPTNVQNFTQKNLTKVKIFKKVLGGYSSWNTLYIQVAYGNLQCHYYVDVFQDIAVQIEQAYSCC